jgi:hypothetical protein
MSLPDYSDRGLQQQYVLYSQATLDSEATVLLDPNSFSEDGTVALKVPSWRNGASRISCKLDSNLCMLLLPPRKCTTALTHVLLEGIVQVAKKLSQ